MSVAVTGIGRDRILGIKEKGLSSDTAAVTSVDETISLRYAATCATCGKELRPRDLAHWDKETRTATCAPCLETRAEAEAQPPAEIDRGEAGASAADEWRRRHERRETQIRGQHKHLGGLILALTDDPQSTKAWDKGAAGERGLGRSLDGLRDEGFAVLHDRCIPGTRANIDHIVVSPAGVFVIDTKNWNGRVEQRDVGGWFRTDLRLYVGGRDQTKHLAGMNSQLEAVKHALAASADWRGVPVTGAFCFVSSENWSLLDRHPLRFGDVYVLWGKALGKLIRAEGPLTSAQIAEIERELAFALPPR